MGESHAPVVTTRRALPVHRQTSVCDADADETMSPTRAPPAVGGVTRATGVTVPGFPPAAQPDIVRAAQKDETYASVRHRTSNDFSHFDFAFRRRLTRRSFITRHSSSRKGSTTSRRARSVRDSPCVTRGRCV